MGEDTLRVIVPAGWTDEEVAEGLLALVQDVSKGLKSPLPSTDRATARAGFLRLQGRFEMQFRAIVDTVDDTAQHGSPALLDRQHRRATAQTNALLDAAYEAAFTFGLRAGGTARDPLPNELHMLQQLRLNENSYAGNFLTDIAHHEGTLDYQARATLYVNALEEVFWQGYTYADLSRGRYVRWVVSHGSSATGEVENCPDCAALSGNLEGLSVKEHDRVQGSGRPIGGRWGNGVYAADELARMGIYPQSGKLACTTNCHCRLVPAEKPKGKPRRAKIVPYQSLAPKDFTGTQKDEQGRVRVAREHKVERRKGYAQRAEDTEHRHVRRTGGRR